MIKPEWSKVIMAVEAKRPAREPGINVEVSALNNLEGQAFILYEGQSSIVFNGFLVTVERIRPALPEGAKWCGKLIVYETASCARRTYRVTDDGVAVIFRAPPPYVFSLMVFDWVLRAFREDGQL